MMNNLYFSLYHLYQGRIQVQIASGKQMSAQIMGETQTPKFNPKINFQYGFFTIGGVARLSNGIENMIARVV